MLALQETTPPEREREFVFDEMHFRFLADLTHARTGIVLTAQKRDMVYGRLVRRLRALRMESFAEYCDFLITPEGEAEIEHLVNAITTNLTSFFREWHHFEHLRDVALPECGPRLRLWSAACSSGMEPYSMAMVLHEAGADADGRDAKILATDIDSNMLATGSAGEYANGVLKDFPEPYRQYAHPAVPERIRMDEAVRRLISFRKLNLLEEWPMQGPFDAIFCRNVVIYFDKPTKETLFDRMAELLKPGGWLYIGHSENLNGITTRFKLEGRTIYRRVA